MKPRWLLTAIATLPLVGAGAPAPQGGPPIAVVEVRDSQYIRCILYTELDVVLAVPQGVARSLGNGQSWTVNYTFEYLSGGVPTTASWSNPLGGISEGDGPHGTTLLVDSFCQFDVDPGTTVTATATLTR